MAKRKAPAPAGLAGDPALFKVMAEITIISNLANTELERHMPGGLTRAQFGVLNHLLRLDRRETVGELADAFQVAQPTMSSTVKRLIDKGLAEFIPDAEDRRIKRVAVTMGGRKTRDAAVAAVAPHLAELGKASSDIDWGATLEALSRIRVYLEARR